MRTSSFKYLLSVVFVLVWGTAADAAVLTFTWDANSESDLAGYRLWQGDKSGGPYVLVGDIPLSYLEDPAVPQWVLVDAPVHRAFFVLTAYDTENLESGYSNEVGVNIPPGNPQNFRVTITIIVVP